MSPTTTMEILGWLVGQLSDGSLLTNSSLYKERLGQTITSSLFNLVHNPMGPSVSPHTGDGHLAKGFEIITEGRLKTLLPSDYCSKKLGLSHTPWVNAISVA